MRSTPRCSPARRPRFPDSEPRIPCLPPPSPLQVKDIAIDPEVQPYVYNPRAAARASNPDRRRKWLIPLILLAQIGIKLLLDRWVGAGEKAGLLRGMGR